MICWKWEGSLLQKIKICEEVIIENPCFEIKKWCNENLIIKNPEYNTKFMLGLWIGETPEYLYLYKINGNKIIIPIGAFGGIKKFIDRNADEIEIDLADDKKFSFNANVDLYDYQKKAVDSMAEKGFGILKSAAGSGKTQMGIALACRLGYKTLWLTHTQDLLTQSYNRAAQYIDKKYLGRITAGKIDIKDGITFATVQTLCKQDLSYFRKEFNTIIVDECHRASGTPTKATQFSKVLSRLAARHKFGLSATVHRGDGLIKTCFALLGSVAYEVPDSDAANNIMRARILKRNTDTKSSDRYLDTDGTVIYAKLISYLCEDKNRNILIANDLIQNSNRYNLILSDRINHLECIKNLLPEGDSVLISGSDSKSKREKIIYDMKNGNKRYLFATYQLAKEGLDIPRLDRLFLVTPHSDYAVVTQAVGRISRVFEGKGEPVVYDYTDSNIGLLEKKFKQRCTSYKKCNCIL